MVATIIILALLVAGLSAALAVLIFRMSNIIAGSLERTVQNSSTAVAETIGRTVSGILGLDRPADTQYNEYNRRVQFYSGEDDEEPETKYPDHEFDIPDLDSEMEADGWIRAERPNP